MWAVFLFMFQTACDDVGADHLVAEAGETVGGVCVEGELEERCAIEKPLYIL